MERGNAVLFTDERAAEGKKTPMKRGKLKFKGSRGKRKKISGLERGKVMSLPGVQNSEITPLVRLRHWGTRDQQGKTEFRSSLGRR